MTVVTVGSVVGAPGATTTALALARRRTRPVVMLEADPDGGRLALRLDTDHRPGLVDLLTSARDLTAEESFGWVQRPDAQSGARLVIAHPSGDVVERALRAGVRQLVATLRGASFDVVCDVGRYRADSAAGPLAEAAAWRVVVTHGALVEVAVLSHALERLRQLGPVAVVLTGDGPYTAREVAEALDVPTVRLPVPGAVPGRRYLRALDELSAPLWSEGPR